MSARSHDSCYVSSIVYRWILAVEMILLLTRRTVIDGRYDGGLALVTNSVKNMLTVHTLLLPPNNLEKEADSDTGMLHCSQALSATVPQNP